MKNLTVLILLMFCPYVLLAQSITKTITYDENEKIVGIQTLNLATAVTTKNKTKNYPNQHKIYVYDNAGNLKLQLKNLDIIPYTTYIAQNNSIILVMHKSSGRMGVVKSIDIPTGKENWSINCFASDYTISPTGKFLLSAASAIFDPSKVELINLLNGTQETIEFKSQQFAADWLNEEEIIFINSVTEIEKRSNKSQSNSEIGKINEELDKLREQAKNSSITRDEYNDKVNKLVQKKDKLRSEQYARKKKRNRSELIKKKGEMGPKIINRHSTVMIYNIFTKTIGNSKAMLINDKNLFVVPNTSDISTINVDPQNNIYVSAYQDGERYLLKYDNKLNLLNSFLLEKGFYLNKITMDDKLVFRVTIKNKDIVILDEDMGKVRKLVSGDKNAEEIMTFSKNLKNYDLTKNIRLNKGLHKIKFIKKEEKK